MIIKGLSPEESVAADLIHALVRMDVVAALDAFERGANPKMRDIDYPTAWQWIRRNPEGATLIQDVVLISGERRGNGNRMDMFEMLIEKGCPIHGSNYDGYTALHNAALINHTPAAKRLIELGASVDAQSRKGFTALQTAVKYMNNEVVSYLLAKEAKSTIRNHRMEDAADYAARHNNKEAQSIVHSATARGTAMSILEEIDLSGVEAPPKVNYQSPWTPPSPRRLSAG